MGIPTTIDFWDDPESRAVLKPVFGNRRNFEMFCLIEHRLASRLWELSR